MKPNLSKFLILLNILLINCTTYKKQFSENGTENQAIENAIIDFVNTNKLLKKPVVHLGIKKEKDCPFD